MVQIPVREMENKIFKPDRLPVLLYAGQISNEPAWSFQSHKHEDLSEIIYIREGEGEFIINNRYYKARTGDVLVYNQGILHAERSNPDKPLRTYFCGVGNLHIEGMEEGLIIPASTEPVIHTDRYRYKVENYISDIFEECNSQVSGYEMMCQSLLISLIILIMRITGIGSPAQDLTASTTLGDQIREYIDKNYTRDISLNEIANRLYISPYYLSHTFKNETGYSPINYAINRRIGEAKKLLLTTDLPIQEIAGRVGYDSTNYFTMLFKKVTSLSPSKFREASKKGT